MIDREFRIGDRVTCNIYGLGEVIEIDNDYITVIFSNKIIGTYSKDGKYNINTKRTLFVLPKKKPTKQQMKEKFKQLLDNVEEVEFIHGEENYTVRSYYWHEEKEYHFKVEYWRANEYFNHKYISKQNAERIAEEMNEFKKGE